MPEVLQEREPSRRPVVVVAVLLAALVAVAAYRVVSGDAEPRAARGGSRSSAAGALTTTGSFRSATDHGEYAYTTKLRSSAPVTVLHVTPLDDNGWVMDPVVAAALPGTDLQEPLALRAPAPAAPLDVPPGGEFVVLVRIRPDCASARPLAALRVSLRLADGREVLQNVTLDEPGAGLRALPRDTCQDATGPVGDRPVLELTGGGGSRYFGEDVHSYEPKVLSVWPAPVTVLSVVPVDAAGDPVPVELATLVLDDGGVLATDPELTAAPVELPAGADAVLIVRMRTTCARPITVAAYVLTVQVGGETVEQVLSAPAHQQPRCGPRPSPSGG